MRLPVFPSHPKLRQHPSRSDYLAPFSRSNPPVSFILRHVSRRDWVIFVVGAVLVSFISFWAIFLNFSHSETLEYLEDPTFQGVITIDELPLRSSDHSATKTAMNVPPASVTIDLSYAQLQDAISHMEETNSSSAHLTYLCFTGNIFFKQTGIKLLSGDFIDVKITSAIAIALLESAKSDAASPIDPDATMSIIIPISKRPFSDWTLKMRACFQDLSWRTGLKFQDIFSAIALIAAVAVILYLLWCRRAYLEAKYSANGDIIIMGDNSFPDDFDDIN